MKYLAFLLLAGCSVERVQFGPSPKEVVPLSVVQQALQQRDAALAALLQRVEKLEKKDE